MIIEILVGPTETVTLAIVMDDLDHPIQPGFNHWVAWNITPVSKILNAMDEYILAMGQAKGELIGKYQRKHKK